MDTYSRLESRQSCSASYVNTGRKLRRFPGKIIDDDQPDNLSPETLWPQCRQLQPLLDRLITSIRQYGWHYPERREVGRASHGSPQRLSQSKKIEERRQRLWYHLSAGRAQKSLASTGRREKYRRTY